MSKEIKEMIELFLINIGMVFLIFFPERSNIFDYKEHKVLAIICYLAILFIFVAFGYLLLEPWFF